MTDDYQSIITSAFKVDATTIFPPEIGQTIIAGYRAQHDILLDLYSSAYAAVEEIAWGGGNTVCIATIRPLSRGSIAISTTDPREPPVYDFGTFLHPSDLEIAAYALKRVRE